MSPDDRFHAIGFTPDEIFAGGAFKIIRLSLMAMRKANRLQQRFGSLIIAEQQGRITREDGEIYFVNRFLDEPSFRRFTVEYQIVYFFSEPAFRFCSENKIDLPDVIETLARANLSKGLGIAARFPVYTTVI